MKKLRIFTQDYLMNREKYDRMASALGDDNGVATVDANGGFSPIDKLDPNNLTNVQANTRLQFNMQDVNEEY